MLSLADVGDELRIVSVSVRMEIEGPRACSNQQPNPGIQSLTHSVTHTKLREQQVELGRKRTDRLKRETPNALPIDQSCVSFDEPIVRVAT